MNEFTIAVGLFFVIEGMVYGLFPKQAKEMLRILMDMDTDFVRYAGLLSMLLGFAIIWLVQH